VQNFKLRRSGFGFSRASRNIERWREVERRWRTHRREIERRRRTYRRGRIKRGWWPMWWDGRHGTSRRLLGGLFILGWYIGRGRNRVNYVIPRNGGSDCGSFHGGGRYFVTTVGHDVCVCKGFCGGSNEREGGVESHGDNFWF
jgi:hypothetical protein